MVNPRNRGRSGSLHKHAFRPSLERLEDRVVPAGELLAPSGLPLLDSLPGATSTLYLNFAGEQLAGWMGKENITIPAFSLDSNPAFSSAEADVVREIWRVVAQDYAPFNLNVTTVDPRTLAGYRGQVSQIDVGGDGLWFGYYAGIAEVGSVVGSSVAAPARGFVFPLALGNNTWFVSQAIAHESGHTMGLDHQADWVGNVEVAEYYTGPGDNGAPIIGESYSVSRGMWWYGKSGSGRMQDDVAVIAGAVGLRADEAGDTVASAAPVTITQNTFRADGIIGTEDDVDVWSFTTDAGAVSVAVSTPDNGMLRPKFRILDSNGNVVRDWVDRNRQSDSWTGTLKAGSYRLVIAAHGLSPQATPDNHGIDVGEYTITGKVVAPASSLPAPSSLKAVPVSANQIALSWLEAAASETGFAVERSVDRNQWVSIATVNPDTTRYDDAAVQTGVKYYYRVQAFQENDFSAYSNQASAQAVPARPASASNVTAVRVASRQVRITWQDNSSDELGFFLDRAVVNIRGGVGSFTKIRTLGPNVTEYIDKSVAKGVKYVYRVRSFNITGFAPPSKNTPKISGLVTPGSQQLVVTPIDPQPTFFAPSKLVSLEDFWQIVDDFLSNPKR